MQARNEVRVLASLSHPNIVKYYETFVDEKSGKLQIVMEFCEVPPPACLPALPAETRTQTCRQQCPQGSCEQSPASL